MSERLILLRHEKHPNGLEVFAYLNELTVHSYAIGFFPNEGGWMMVDTGVGKPHLPEPISLPGQPGKVYGIFTTHGEALATLESHDASLNEPEIGRHKHGFRPRHIQVK